MIDNLHRPVDHRRLKGILAWRSELSESERQRLNHPTSILRLAKKQSWTIISMKNDWKRIFAFE